MNHLARMRHREYLLSICAFTFGIQEAPHATRLDAVIDREYVLTFELVAIVDGPFMRITLKGLAL